ncbi:MAG: hypothetical protein JEZ11_24090 [Desulfobacterales bacterium]|nr:hypothetical protein [Desulfobacterales bacterium]
MKRRSSNIYKLIPSKQSRSNSTAPMSFIPAIPVRLKADQDRLQYALIDTTAEISVIDESILKNMDSKSKPYSYANVQGVTGIIAKLKIIYMELIVCTPIGEPWLAFHNVPFVVTKTKPIDRPGMLIGYDSALSNLRLSLDFPRKELRISAPIDFELLSEKSSKQYLPSSIIEAENLIRMGSYRAALPMIISALEEVLSSKIAENNHRSPISYLMNQNWLSNRMKGELKKAIDLRNHAVHGFDLIPIKKKEAQSAMRTIKTIIAQIQGINT